MNIDSIGFGPHHASDGGRTGRSHRIEVGADEVRKKVEDQAEDIEPPITDVPDPAPEVEETQEAKGVLRLLEEGHFRGVADIRLRINFFEELAGSEPAEPSPPKGNGGAYQKFLEIYRNMQGIDGAETPDSSSPVEAPDNPEPVDVVA